MITDCMLEIYPFKDHFLSFPPSCAIKLTDNKNATEVNMEVNLLILFQKWLSFFFDFYIYPERAHENIVFQNAEKSDDNDSSYLKQVDNTMNV